MRNLQRLYVHTPTWYAQLCSGDCASFHPCRHFLGRGLTPSWPPRCWSAYSPLTRLGPLRSPCCRGVNYIPADSMQHGLVQTERYNAARKRYHAEGALVSYFDKVRFGVMGVSVGGSRLSLSLSYTLLPSPVYQP